MINPRDPAVPVDIKIYLHHVGGAEVSAVSEIDVMCILERCLSIVVIRRSSTSYSMLLGRRTNDRKMLNCHYASWLCQNTSANADCFHIFYQPGGHYSSVKKRSIFFTELIIRIIPMAQTTEIIRTSHEINIRMRYFPAYTVQYVPRSAEQYQLGKFVKCIQIISVKSHVIQTSDCSGQ